jgi:hypothetical protein
MDWNINKVGCYVYEIDDIHDGVENDIISESESQVKIENDESGFIVHQNISEVVDLNLEPEVKHEVKSEIDYFDMVNYDMPHFTGEKRKNHEIGEIKTKKCKEEFVMFEESYDDQPQTELNVQETDIKVFKYPENYDCIRTSL